MMRLLFILGLCFTSFHWVSAQGLDLSPFSDWQVEIEAEDIRAGDDIQTTYNSRRDQVKMNVEIGSNSFFNMLYAEWKLEVHREDREWHPDLELYIRRTGQGNSYSHGHSHGNAIKGGKVYQRITQSPEDFMECRGWRYNIPFQIKIKGVSLLLPAKSYRTQIVFTITDN